MCCWLPGPAFGPSRRPLPSGGGCPARAEGMTVRDRLTALYIGLTCATAVAIVATDSWLPLREIEWVWWSAGLLLILAVAAELLAVPLPKAGYVSASTVAHVAGALLL